MKYMFIDCFKNKMLFRDVLNFIGLVRNIIILRRKNEYVKFENLRFFVNFLESDMLGILYFGVREIFVFVWLLSFLLIGYEIKKKKQGKIEKWKILSYVVIYFYRN